MRGDAVSAPWSAAVAGYLFFTDAAAQLRRQIEPALDDFARELSQFPRHGREAAGVASEGWKLLNEAIGEPAPRASATPIRTRRARSEGAHGMINLDTTNLLLGIMAAVSVLEALVLDRRRRSPGSSHTGGHDARGRRSKRGTSRPPMARVNAILDDVKGVTAKVKDETERVDHAIRSTIDRVDDTADRVRSERAREDQPGGRLRPRRARRDRDDAALARA